MINHGSVSMEKNKHLVIDCVDFNFSAGMEFWPGMFMPLPSFAHLLGHIDGYFEGPGVI